MSEINTIFNIKDPDVGWIPIPAIQGTSVYTTAIYSTYRDIPSEESTITQYGWVIRIYDEKKAKLNPSYQYDELTVWDGLDGSGAVETVDGQHREEGTTNIKLDAVSYGHAQPSITEEQKLQARTNIDAFKDIENPGDGQVPQYIAASSGWFAADLIPGNVGAVHSALKINNVSITSPTTASASIVLTPNDIGAIHSALKINTVSITNPTTDSASITLTPSNIGAVHSALKINGVSITSPTTASASITLTPQAISAVPITREINGVQLSRDIVTRVRNNGDVNVTYSAWASDSAYETEGFGFKATIPFNGVTESMIPHVSFNMADSISGIYSPIAATASDVVYIYASAVPSQVVNVTAINFEEMVQEGIYIVDDGTCVPVTDQDEFDATKTYYSNITTKIPSIICFT